MFKEKPMGIVLISFYCFLLGFFFFSLAINSFINKSADLSFSNPIVWLPVAASLIFTLFLVCVGIGFLNLKQIFWKILFFFLMISVSSLGSLIFAGLIIYFSGFEIAYVFIDFIRFSPLAWNSLLCFFFSEIIVLYYLNRYEITHCFGEMGGGLAKPF